MSATTLHTFPAASAFTSPRGLVLAAIVLLHVALAWALSNGLSRPVVSHVPPNIVARFIDPPPAVEPPPPVRDFRPMTAVPIPVEGLPVLPTIAEGAISMPVEGVPDPVPDIVPTPPAPVIVQPGIDPTLGLSEPMYPAQDVRLGNAGTVLVAVLVLPDGRVGEVRLERSSGYPRLDASALTEAKQWRFRPGTSDGVSVALWKLLPVTFRLKE